MLEQKLADKLTKLACDQLIQGLKGKEKRMKTVSDIIDLYNNKVMDLGEEVMNIPFPYLAGHVDLLYSKVDNPPTLTFKIPNKRGLSEKVQSAWNQEMNSTKAGWRRKDRAEKKIALLSGRGVAKIYASSVNKKYKSHYDVVDVYSFVSDPMYGDIERGNYHGEVDIFKTRQDLKAMAELGVYDKGQVEKLLNINETEVDGVSEVSQFKFDRLKALGIDVQTASYAGQKGVNLTEWVMRFEGEMYYLMFDPARCIWVRAELLSEVFESGKTPYVSWATHYDEYSFWTKGIADDIYPIAEAMRFLLNTTLENEKRRTRPMRVVDSGALIDVNELQDYVPDNVILRNPGKDPNIVTIETPQATTTINLVQYLDNLIQSKSGVSEPGVEERDTKVGVFFGKLAQEADRIGAYNKEYSESYAHKGYRFFWGLKEHLSSPKQIEMLGKGGIKLGELSKIDMDDVDDVDDVMVSGGSREEELTTIENEQQLRTITELAAAYPDKLNPDWVIRNILRRKGVEEDEIDQALDMESATNRDSVEEADAAIQSVMLGNTPNLNMSADSVFGQRIIDYVRENLNYVKLNKKGEEVGVDKKMQKKAELLLAHVNAHKQIMLQNVIRKQKKAQIGQMAEQAGIAPQGTQGAEAQIDLPTQTQQDKQLSVAQPFEGETSEGVARASQNISNALSK